MRKKQDRFWNLVPRFPAVEFLSPLSGEDKELSGTVGCKKDHHFKSALSDHGKQFLTNVYPFDGSYGFIVENESVT